MSKATSLRPYEDVESLPRVRTRQKNHEDYDYSYEACRHRGMSSRLGYAQRQPLANTEHGEESKSLHGQILHPLGRACLLGHCRFALAVSQSPETDIGKVILLDSFAVNQELQTNVKITKINVEVISTRRCGEADAAALGITAGKMTFLVTPWNDVFVRRITTKLQQITARS